MTDTLPDHYRAALDTLATAHASLAASRDPLRARMDALEQEMRAALAGPSRAVEEAQAALRETAEHLLCPWEGSHGRRDSSGSFRARIRIAEETWRAEVWVLDETGWEVLPAPPVASVAELRALADERLRAAGYFFAPHVWSDDDGACVNCGTPNRAVR